MVQVAGFQVGNFDVYLPKYARSLQLSVDVDDDGGEALAINVEEDPAFDSLALAFPPSGLIVSSELAAALNPGHTSIWVARFRNSLDRIFLACHGVV
jgi:hypothetical protein